MKISPKMLAVLVFSGGLLLMAYQVYELDKFRREMWAMRPNAANLEKQAKPNTKTILAQLAKEDLMGSPRAQSVKPIVQASVVDTSLKLELVGTIRGGVGGEADSALIGAKGKETKRYYLGNTIEGGAILHTVNEDSVLIKRGEKLETLRYAKSQPPAIIPSIKPTPAPKNPAPASSDESVKTNNQQQKTLSLRERLKQKRQGINPQND